MHFRLETAALAEPPVHLARDARPDARRRQQKKRYPARMSERLTPESSESKMKPSTQIDGSGQSLGPGPKSGTVTEVGSSNETRAVHRHQTKLRGQ